MGIKRLLTGVGVVGEPGWIVSLEGQNGNLELAVVDEGGM